MKSIRTRVIVALASSAVLASGLGAVAVVGAASSAAVSVADGATSGTGSPPTITVYDP